MRYAATYRAATSDEMVDISSGVNRRSSGGSRYANQKGNDPNNNKKKIIIIASSAAAVVIAVAIACIFIFFANQKSEPEKVVPKEFTFADKTTVSGIDISGKTMKEAKALLENNKSSFITPIKFSIKIADDTAELTQKDFEYTYNIDQVLNQVKADEESKTSKTSKEKTEYSVKATVTDDSVTKKVDALVEEHESEPVDAYVSDFHPYSQKRFDFVGEVSGLDVDGDSLKAEMLKGFTKGQNYCEIEAEVTETEAEVTEDFLKNNLVKLATYETYSTNTENGTTNMTVSLKACNGSIIDPGETWSFNECTGDSNLESNGYKSAHVISEGKIIDGIGGGICQSSSTIYNAAIRANMEIVERYNHKWASAYVPTGLDATIDYPNLDLVLRNASGYQMFLECKVEDYTLYATFWGYQDPSYDEIKTSNELKNTGGSTYSVRAWRIYYKDGKKVNEEELPSSSYDTENGVIFYPADTDDHEKTDDDTDVQTYNDTDYSDVESSYVEPETVPETDPPVEQTEAPVVTEYAAPQNEQQADTVTP